MANTVEICFRERGRNFVKYRREEGSDGAMALIKQVEELQARQGKECKYFYRIVKSKK